TGGGGGGGGAEPRGATANGEVEACGERLGFSETPWEPAPRVPPNVPAGTVLWQARFTFTNPNPVEVRLSDAVVILELDSADGHRAGAGRTAFLDPAPAAVAPRSTLERSAQAWLRDGKIPKTTQVYAATQATIGGVACSVAVERVSTTPPSPQVFTLADCGAEPC
ncbi:MAG TPA: hypothetical protein VM390_00625, partial [Acidimicrobiales bacterium]|nr:hypothetical protein [Acidimicrobiales bacterium]